MQCLRLVRYVDTSSSAIVASALVELSTYLDRRDLLHHANRTVSTLLSDPRYIADDTAPAVLWGNRHDCGSDSCTVIETDYYLLEAIRRLATLA
mmetsp:Transcript_11893/g.27974  ORF Transcript_11893/g.27974 Transcript_11893/m.27974 type:complete len:94 (+) Transcript_11893:349-630(+)